MRIKALKSSLAREDEHRESLIAQRRGERSVPWEEVKRRNGL